MRRILMTLMGLLFLVSCGGGGGGSSSGGGGTNDPSLRLESATPSVQVGQSAKVVVGFSDSEGDISTIFIRERFNTKDATTTFSAGDLLITGKSGTGYFFVDYPTTASRGQHNYEVWVTDAKGSRSNTLSFSINVT